VIFGQKYIPVLEHTLYLPDLVPSDFCIPETKILKGCQVESFEEIQNNLMTVVKGLSNNDFQQCFQA
jgi:hypothetical protein